MVPPDPTVMNEIMKGSAETLRIAILGSLGAVILSVPLGILASETMVSPALFRPVRTLLQRREDRGRSEKIIGDVIIDAGRPGC